MERELIKNVKPGEKVKISGFVENLRNKRTMCFIVLKDISGKMQVTIEKEKN
ncbi:MAG TPA: aspartate--tRNA(Asn) ligase, partial [Clostridiales bacterium]|nr:aspartate--tRNA(Asn) ligase [Clostridiales bacterium]